MGKRTNAVKRLDATEIETPLDTTHESRAGIYDAPFEDTTDPTTTETADTMTPTTEEAAMTALDTTDEITPMNDMPVTTNGSAEITPISDAADTMEPVDADTSPVYANDRTTSWDDDITAPSTGLYRVTTNEDADMVGTPESATAETEPTEAEPEESADIQAARARIEQTRAEMSSTIDAIKEKLSPQHVLQEARDTARTKAEEMAHTAVETTKDMVNQAKDKMQEVAPKIVQTVKRNPVPFLAGGLVFGWLLLRSRSRHKDYCD